MTEPAQLTRSCLMMILTSEEFVGGDEPLVRIGIASHNCSYVIPKPKPDILTGKKVK
jgi:hypothetical protein